MAKKSKIDLPLPKLLVQQHKFAVLPLEDGQYLYFKIAEAHDGNDDRNDDYLSADTEDRVRALDGTRIIVQLPCNCTNVIRVNDVPRIIEALQEFLDPTTNVTSHKR